MYDDFFFESWTHGYAVHRDPASRRIPRRRTDPRPAIMFFLLLFGRLQPSARRSRPTSPPPPTCCAEGLGPLALDQRVIHVPVRDFARGVPASTRAPARPASTVLTYQEDLRRPFSPATPHFKSPMRRNAPYPCPLLSLLGPRAMQSLVSFPCLRLFLLVRAY
jgi:hypothetical protein